MFKSINLKKLTINALIGSLMIGGLIAQSSSKVNATNGVQGLELRYLDSAFQCGPDGTQADIKVRVYEDDSLLTTMSKGDTYTNADIDSVSDLRFEYKILNTCESEAWGQSKAIELLGSQDEVPNILGYSGQDSINQMLQNIDSYEELYLVELGTNDPSIPTYDLQDVVLVVDNNPDSLVVVAPEDNAEPVAQADNIITDEDSSTTYNLISGDPNNNDAGKDSDPDGDALTITEFKIGNDTYNLDGQSAKQVTMPSGALLTVNKAGDVSYDPNGKFESLEPDQTAQTPDSFSYTVSDPDGATDTATATVDITGMADNPIAKDDQVTTNEDEAEKIYVLENDTDPNTDKEDLTITKINGVSVAIGNVVTLNSGATVKLVEIGDESEHDTSGTYALEYDPTSSVSLNNLDQDEIESEMFTYTVSDPELNTDEGNVTVEVKGITNYLAD